MDVRVAAGANPIHLRAFDEVKETILWGLHHSTYEIPDRTIVLNPHALPGAQGHPFTPDERLILYNFEQHDSPTLNNSVLHFFRQHEVWDYSPSNVAWFAKHGIKAKHVPLGYVPEMRRIKRVKPDIDVLFYGLVNNRRRKILDDLRASGLTVCEVSNCYAQERDQLIGRSKLVLNMHFYETGIFEIVRCSYLFANEVCVVSEESINVPRELIDAGFLCASYDRLVDTCLFFTRYPDSAAKWATQAHKAFQRCDETAILRRAIEG